MSVAVQRLALLRKQAGVEAVRPTLPAAARSAAPSAADDSGGDPLHMVQTLRRLLRSSSVSGNSQRLPARAIGCVDRSLPGKEIADGLRLVEKTVPLAAPSQVTVSALWPLQSRGLPSTASSNQLLFFDTETTGLSGGTGTRAFMIGAADFVDYGLRLRQLLITSLNGEAAMLDEFSRWLEGRLLVSYNGKSFDAPLLRTRWQLQRRRDASRDCHHLDLLYPVRRLYREVLPDCRLATVERELLNVARANDLPGSEAPAAFRSWLRGGSAEPLRGVLDHNAQDLVSLARLLLWLTQSAR